MKIRLSYTNYINFLVLLFFIAIVFKRTAMDAVFLTVSFTGIYFSIRYRKLPFQIKELQLLTALFWGYFVAVVAAVVSHPSSAEVVGFLTRELYFILAPFSAMALIRSEINLNWLALGSKLGLLMIGGIVIFEYFLGISRPSGFLNANMFANLAILLFFIVVVIGLTERRKGLIVLTVISLLFGGIAIIYTGGRSAWIAFVLLFFVVIFLQFKQHYLLKRKVVLLAMAVLFIVATLGSFNNTLKQRTSLAFNNVVEWINGDLTMSSAGQRLEMIRIGVIEAPNVPFFGNGYRNINQSIITEKYDQEVHNRIRTYTQLHNAYLTNFVGGGYPLLMALLLNLFIPFMLFKKSLLDNKNQLYASIGVVVSVGFMIFGLFNNLFGDVFMNAAYTFIMAIFLPGVSKLKYDR